MSDAAVEMLARAAGILIDWEDADGVTRRVSPESLRAVLNGLGFACGNVSDCTESLARLREGAADRVRIVDVGTKLSGLSGNAILHLEDGDSREIDLATATIDTMGYHVLEHSGGTLPLIVAPPRCTMLAVGERRWGLALQLYSLKGKGAFGDFGDLADLARRAAAAGADAVSLSPVHALFTGDPSRYSPYSPSSREFLNPWYAESAARGGGDDDLIDWPDAVGAKLTALHEAFAADRHDPRFVDHVRAASPELRDHALFEALHAHFHAERGAQGWQGWPAAYQDPASAAVAAFAIQHAEEIDFHLYLQWRAEEGLATAATAAADMRIGLVSDIAVGLDAGGSHAWTRRDELMMGIGIGAPPDAFQRAGQGWGITSFSPFALTSLGYAPFVRLLRSAMRHAGGIRIDHALGLRRLWVVPNGASPLEGAYLRQPEADLLRVIALESTRAGAIVIGEDLGVVPPGLRDVLAGRGLLGMRVLPFERDRDGVFTPPADWDRAAVAMTSTHDLPPIAGWWRETDIDWRDRLGAAGDRTREREDRAADRTALWTACVEAGTAAGPEPAADEPAPAVEAAVAFAARSASAIVMIPVEDLLALEEAPNLPGTIDEHPNWRRRLPDTAAALLARDDVAARLDRLRTERPS